VDFHPSDNVGKDCKSGLRLHFHEQVLQNQLTGTILTERTSQYLKDLEIIATTLFWEVVNRPLFKELLDDEQSPQTEWFLI